MQTLFEEEGDKIWAQAGIDLVFLDFNQFNSTAYTNLDPNAEFDSLVYGPGHGQNLNPLVVNMWFVWGLVNGAYGVGYLDAAGVAIDQDVFVDGRIDTIAHELGHNLGLDHNDSSGSNLMASGGVRQVPTTIADIYPDPPGRDQLSGTEIAIARSSDLLTVAVPEPGTLGLMVAALLAITVTRRASVRCPTTFDGVPHGAFRGLKPTATR